MRDDESGLSTLEWILIVAAVGGLATMGIFIVRNATDATSEQVDGETDQVMTAEHTEAEADMTRIMQSAGLRNTGNRNEIKVCRVDYYLFYDNYFNSEGVYVGHQNQFPSAVMSILDKWGDTFYFAPKVVDQDGDGDTKDDRNTGYCAAYPYMSS